MAVPGVVAVDTHLSCCKHVKFAPLLLHGPPGEFASPDTPRKPQISRLESRIGLMASTTAASAMAYHTTCAG
jgi:hypothetical protein